MSWGERSCKFSGFPGGCPHGATMATCNTWCPHYAPKETPNPDSVKRYDVLKPPGPYPGSVVLSNTGRYVLFIVYHRDVKVQAETITELKREIAELKDRWANMVGECHG